MHRVYSRPTYRDSHVGILYDIPTKTVFIAPIYIQYTTNLNTNITILHNGKGVCFRYNIIIVIYVSKLCRISITGFLISQIVK